MLRPSAREYIKINKEPLTVLELGVWTGENAINMYNEMNIEHMYLIDRWYQKYEHYNFPEIKTFPQRVFDKFYDKNNVTIIRSDTLEAASFFPDEFFDYAYLDDNHSYEHVYKELRLYYPKLKKGAMYGGDNYEMPAVSRAVNEFCKEYKLDIKTEVWKKTSANTDVLDWFGIKK